MLGVEYYGCPLAEQSIMQPSTTQHLGEPRSPLNAFISRTCTQGVFLLVGSVLRLAPRVDSNH